jgi:hypothetical protein
MMQKFSNTWSLMSASWEVLKKDREMLIFPLISGVCCLLVMVSFALPIFLSESWQTFGGETSGETQVIYYLLLFAFYFCNYFIIVFFNSAVVSCAVIRMRGGDPTVSDGLRASTARLPLIAGWALVAATVGIVLRIIEDRSKNIGKIVASLLGTAWTLASFLVVPIMVVENINPLDALKKSASMFKKTWGEQIIGNFSFGLVFFVLGIPAVLLFLIGIVSGSIAMLVVFVILAAIYLIVLALVQSTLQTIFQAALYFYSQNGKAPQGFSADLLNNSIARK